jgi:6-phosphogluconolactonase (cycloisomerase 2 family)
MNAYQVIQHNSSKVDIDFDPSQNHLYSADEAGLALFQIDEARLKLQFANQSMVGKSQELIVTATSTDPSNPKKIVTCQ